MLLQPLLPLCHPDSEYLLLPQLAIVLLPLDRRLLLLEAIGAAHERRVVDFWRSLASGFEFFADGLLLLKLPLVAARVCAREELIDAFLLELEVLLAGVLEVEAGEGEVLVELLCTVVSKA